MQQWVSKSDAWMMGIFLSNTLQSPYSFYTEAKYLTENTLVTGYVCEWLVHKVHISQHKRKQEHTESSMIVLQHWPNGLMSKTIYWAVFWELGALPLFICLAA